MVPSIRASRWPSPASKRNCWTPYDLTFMLQRAPGEVEARPQKGLPLVEMWQWCPCAPPLCGHQEGAPQPIPRAVFSEAGPCRRGAREGLWAPVAMGCGTVGKLPEQPGPPGRGRHARAAGTREREWHRVLLSHRLRRLASPLMSGLPGASFQFRAHGKGVAGLRGYTTSP